MCIYFESEERGKYLKKKKNLNKKTAVCRMHGNEVNHLFVAT